MSMLQSAYMGGVTTTHQNVRIQGVAHKDHPPRGVTSKAKLKSTTDTKAARDTWFRS